jgi:hypothetical protein
MLGRRKLTGTIGIRPLPIRTVNDPPGSAKIATPSRSSPRPARPRPGESQHQENGSLRHYAILNSLCSPQRHLASPPAPKSRLQLASNLDPPARLPVAPTAAFWRSPPVWADWEGRQRVDFARSLNHPATPAPCRTAVIRYVVLARRKCTRFTGSQTRAHASAETKSSGAIAARRTAFGGRPAFCLGGVFLCGDALCADLTVTQWGIALEAAAAPPRCSSALGRRRER